MYEDRIEESILTASRIMVNILAESLLEEKAEHISVAQFRILDMVGNRVDKPSQLARMLDVSPPAVSALSEKLEERGLLLRTVSASDRRRVHLALTPEGERIVERVNVHRRRRLATVLKKMSSSECVSLEDALEGFNRAYRDMKKGTHITKKRTRGSKN